MTDTAKADQGMVTIPRADLEFAVDYLQDRNAGHWEIVKRWRAMLLDPDPDQGMPVEPSAIDLSRRWIDGGDTEVVLASYYDRLRAYALSLEKQREGK